MNRWIVSHHRFHQHETLAAAEAERQRLAAKTGKKFHLYRVKSMLEPDQGETNEGEQG